jgi:hypothetical protein
MQETYFCSALRGLGSSLFHLPSCLLNYISIALWFVTRCRFWQSVVVGYVHLDLHFFCLITQLHVYEIHF